MRAKQLVISTITRIIPEVRADSPLVLHPECSMYGIYIFLTLAHPKNYSNVSTCRKKTYAIWAIHDAFWHVFSPVEDVDVFLNVSPEAVTLYPGYSGPTVLLNLPCCPWGVCDTWGGPNIFFPLKVDLEPPKLVLMKFKWVIEIDLQ